MNKIYLEWEMNEKYFTRRGFNSNMQSLSELSFFFCWKLNKDKWFWGSQKAHTEILPLKKQ